ncbi:MAG: dTMP kinase [Acidiferrobacteraceae bacterium]|nr:dTMP kinase [Acidiferrobacteraceae bacterium]
MRGRFITFEGGDGAGKTTQIELLAQALTTAGQKPLVTREPGGTKLAEEIRNWVLHHASSIDAETEVLLMFAARSHHTKEVIEPALASGRWVLCDRYTDASYAYQGGGRGLPHSLIASLEEIATGGLKPDLTILLDLGINAGIRRTGGRGASHDRFESEESAFKERVRAAYHHIAKIDAGRVVNLDASQAVDELNSNIKLLVNERFGVSID